MEFFFNHRLLQFYGPRLKIRKRINRNRTETDRKTHQSAMGVSKLSLLDCAITQKTLRNNMCQFSGQNFSAKGPLLIFETD